MRAYILHMGGPGNRTDHPGSAKAMLEQLSHSVSTQDTNLHLCMEIVQINHHTSKDDAQLLHV